MIVLDSNVISEMMKSSPDRAVKEWLDRQSLARFFTTAITQSEVLIGLEVMTKGKRRDALLSAAEHMFGSLFAGRILPFDSDAARSSAQLAAERKRRGRPISTSDLQIAAIAHSRGANVATRNTADFEHCGVPVVNPWTA